jgi:endonuclease-3 related protein
MLHFTHSTKIRSSIHSLYNFPQKGGLYLDQHIASEGNLEIVEVYEKLLTEFGRQFWWPAETRFEMMVGAILTQRTTWSAVEVAITNLKREKLLSPHSLANSNPKLVEVMVRSTGFYRQKARRIMKLAKYLVEGYGGSVDRFLSKPGRELRKELLSLEGVGRETADVILLYAADQLVFPIDAYTQRFSRRFGFGDLDYERLKAHFEEQLPRDLQVYKELHALIDELGKTYCKKTPECPSCTLSGMCPKNPD